MLLGRAPVSEPAPPARERIGGRARSIRAYQGLLLVVIAAGALAAGCSADSAVTTGPTQLKCQVALALTSSNIGAEGGTGRVTVTAAPECPWDVSTGASWLSGLSPTSGQGNGTVEFRAAPNPNPSAREGEIVVNDTRVRVSQQAAACRVELRSSGLTIDAGGGSREVAVSAPSGCSWTAATDADWISFTTPVTRSGDGSVGISIAPNSGAERRVGTVAVADQRFTVTQEPNAPGTPPPPAPGCVYVVNSTTQGVLPSGGAEVSATVTVANGCAWTATSSVPWITVVAGASGNGNGTVAFSVAANPGGVRSGTVTVAGQTFTLTQAARANDPCAYSIGPLSSAVAAEGGTGTVAVSAGTGCGWTAVSSVPWLTVTSGATGSGNGAVAYSVAANTGAARTGTITVAGQPFTVTQAAAVVSCTFTIGPADSAMAAEGGSGTVAVSTAAGCAWTASSNAPWIAITSAASGAGSGAVAFSVAANPGSARTGTLTVAGQTFTVTQAAATVPCTYVIDSTSASIGALGGTGTIGVSAGSSCAWTASSNVPWITIASGASGTGNGAVSFAVAPNLGAQRVGIITVAGQSFTVTQAAAVTVCVYTVNPTSISINSGEETRTVTVSTAAGCAWTASSNASWITVTSGASGTGGGSVTFRIERNRNDDDRTGTLTIAGQTVTVRQEGDD